MTQQLSGEPDVRAVSVLRGAWADEEGGRTKSNTLANAPVMPSDERGGASRPESRGGGGVRLLPFVPPAPAIRDPSIDSQSDAAVLQGDKGTGLRNNGGGNTGYGPFFLEYSLMAEYQLMKKTKPSGVYVVPSARCPLVWNGVLFIRQGPYQDAVLRFTLNIPRTFPDGDCPTVQFSAPPVFHPLVHPTTGALDVQRAFPRWRRNYNHIWQVVHFVRKSFYKIDISSPLNPDAASLYEHDAEGFKNRVSESIALCKADLYADPDPSDQHAIRFNPVEPLNLAEKKSKMLLHKDAGLHASHEEGRGGGLQRSIESLGMSWMRAGGGQADIFSKEDTTLL